MSPLLWWWRKKSVGFILCTLWMFVQNFLAICLRVVEIYFSLDRTGGPSNQGSFTLMNSSLTQSQIEHYRIHKGNIIIAVVVVLHCSELHYIMWCFCYFFQLLSGYICRLCWLLLAPKGKCSQRDLFTVRISTFLINISKIFWNPVTLW